MPHYVYLLRCADQSLYTGYTTDPARRLAVHQAGKGAKYTRGRLPVDLLASWEYPSKSVALSEENRIRRLSRKQKLNLAESPSLGV